MLALIPFFFACNDPNSLGVELDDDSAKTQVKTIEFDLPAQTIFIDSLRTEDLGLLACGSITNDTVAGDLKAIAYSDHVIGSGSLPADTIQFVKAYIRLKVSRAYLPDTANDMLNIKVFEASDELFRTATYLANMHTEYDNTTPIGSVESPLKLSSDSLVTIPLDSLYGNKIYQRLRRAQEDEDGDSLVNNLYNYPPLVFEPGDNNQNLLTFNLADSLSALYVEMAHPASATKRFFRYKFSTDHYSEIIRDRSTGKFPGLTKDYDSAGITTGNVYLNTLAGLHPRIDLAPFISFIESSENIIVNRAELTMSTAPANPTFIPPIKRVRYYFPVGDGRINGPSATSSFGRFYAVLNSNGYFGAAAGVNALLTTPYDSGIEGFRDIVTLFTQSLLDTKIARESNPDAGFDYSTTQLILISPDATSVGQTAFRGTEIKLKVYYTELK